MGKASSSILPEGRLLAQASFAKPRRGKLGRKGKERKRRKGKPAGVFAPLHAVFGTNGMLFHTSCEIGVEMGRLCCMHAVSSNRFVLLAAIPAC